MNLNNIYAAFFRKNRLLPTAVLKKMVNNTNLTKSSLVSDILVAHPTLETKIASSIADMLNIPFVEPGIITIDKKLVENFSFSFLKRHSVLPLMITEDNILIVAISDLTDVSICNKVNMNFDGRIEFVFSSRSDINKEIASFESMQDTAQALEDIIEEKADDDAAKPEVYENPLDTLNAPSVKLVDSIIRESIPFRTSDIHVEPGENGVVVRYRIDGELYERANFPVEVFPSVAARIKIMAQLNIAERRLPQDGRIRLMINETEYDFRVSTIPTVHGEKFVLRILDKSIFYLTRSQLGFTPESNEKIDKILLNPHGIILLTGPTGCGKTTTLYSFLKELNKPTTNTVTVEDPVEYSMKGVNQVQVNPASGFTFATALRAIVRQDPDVIMVGEIRDEETAQIASRAAITGHLVLSTLHTNDAAGAVIRLVDMGIPSYLVADSLAGVISQRLVKRLCPKCRKKYTASPGDAKVLGLTTRPSLFKKQGCNYCDFTGYRGRIAVHEIMEINDEIRTAITRPNITITKLQQVAIDNGMKTLFNATKELVLDGVISLSELVRVVVEDE